jgi:dTDP-glucose pyrophosphorylase
MSGAVVFKIEKNEKPNDPPSKMDTVTLYIFYKIRFYLYDV